MKSEEIAALFYSMAEILELLGVKWKPIAYRKAARIVEESDVEKIYNQGGLKSLEELPGIGEGIGKKIVEYLETGKIKEYEKLKKSIPKGLADLLDVPGLGPKKAMMLYKKLQIKSVADLEKAIRQHRIQSLEHFREKSELNLAKGVRIFRQGRARMMLAEAMPVAEYILEKLKSLKEVSNAEIAGSLRRMKPTIGDIDILVSSNNPKAVMDFASKIDSAKEILAKGETKTSLLLKNNIQVDIRAVERKSFGAALQYFTGSKEHNVALRSIAKKQGYKLSEYGLFKNNKMITGEKEADIYKKLGVAFIPPELRENSGEFSAKRLPSLLPFNSIRGDFHVHTDWSDGSDTIEQMALKAKSMGYEYICLADHSKSQRIANGMNEKRLLQKLKAIESVRKKVKGIAILSSTEVDILKDGSMDYSDEILEKLDIVIASVHSSFSMPEEAMTRRIITALENRHVDIIGHLTGKRFGLREPYEVDFERIIRTARLNNKAIEINCSAERMDIDEQKIREAVNANVMLAIGTDAHSAEQMDAIRYGVGLARRGWAEKKDILNSMPLKSLMKWLKH